jgi:hypothetical protein
MVPPLAPFGMQPEYLHVLFNPVLTHALPLGVLALIVAALLRNRAAMVVALVVVLVSAAAVWPAVHYGEAAADRVQSIADLTGGQWLKIHEYRADRWAWLFYATAIAAAAAILLPCRWTRLGRPLAGLTFLLAAAACAAGCYIAFPAGKIRHREFRHAPPPPAELQKAEQAEGD